MYFLCIFFLLRCLNSRWNGYHGLSLATTAAFANLAFLSELTHHQHYTSWRSAIKHTMFEVVYGRGRPALLSYVKGTTKVSCGRRANWRDQMLDELKWHIKEAQAVKHEWRRFIICIIGIGKLLGVCVARPILTGLRFIASKIVSWFHGSTVSFRSCNALVWLIWNCHRSQSHIHLVFMFPC